MNEFSKLFKLNLRDFSKSIVMAFLGAASMTLYGFISKGTLPNGLDEWKEVFIAGISASILYLIKNFLTNSQDEFAKPDPM